LEELLSKGHKAWDLLFGEEFFYLARNFSKSKGKEKDLFEGI